MADPQVVVTITEKGTAKTYSKRVNGADKANRNMIDGAVQLALAYFGTRGIINAFKFATNAASDAQETVSKFEAVFKDQAPAAREFAKELADSANRSEIALVDFLATLQDTFVPLGFARDAASELSQGLVTLAIDVASFSNKIEADVVRDFQSALVGNTETVRKYGIVITQATLEQELINSGLADSVKNATEAEKAQARYNIILEGTTDAQGDAIRTADGFANQMKGLDAAVEELAIAFGEDLLPVLGPAVGLLAEGARSIAEFISPTIEQATALELLDEELQRNIESQKLLNQLTIDGIFASPEQLEALESLRKGEADIRAEIDETTQARRDSIPVFEEVDEEVQNLTVDWGENEQALKDLNKENEAFLEFMEKNKNSIGDVETALDKQREATLDALNSMSSFINLIGGADDDFNKFLNTAVDVLNVLQGIQALKSATGFSGVLGFVGSLFGFATGGIAPGGPIEVNEGSGQTREIIAPPAGTRVFNSAESRDMQSAPQVIQLFMDSEKVGEVLVRNAGLGQNGLVTQEMITA